MKPPRRPREVPARFLTDPVAEAEAAEAEAAEAGRRWSGREKRALLRGLRAQAALGLPEPETRALRERLPRKSEGEIRSLLSRLRGRAAREALSTRYRRGGQRPAPLQVWLALAQTLGGALEGATSAAFSQVLTVAATEPLTLVPPPAGNSGPPLGAPPKLRVSFPRLYRHLALLNRGAPAPPLPPGEAAVLLALLSALPPELGALDLPALRRHFRGSWGVLSAPRAPPGTPPANGDAPGPGDPPPCGWGGVGVSPLNLFLVPLQLLKRGGGPETGE